MSTNAVVHFDAVNTSASTPSAHTNAPAHQDIDWQEIIGHARVIISEGGGGVIYPDQHTPQLSVH